jgi:hypothetical protein
LMAVLNCSRKSSEYVLGTLPGQANKVIAL